MSFLLSAKPRRRSQFTSCNVSVPRGRTLSKDAANIGGGGGQVQIQRHQRSQPRQTTRVFPRQQGLAAQRDQQKQEAVQSAGISMEQVMEDLRVLEEQQHDSQRKLTHIKILKQNRLERSSAVENQLASLKYNNGERRAQLNRAHEILSSATHDMEAVKLGASRNDERLKAIDNKLKEALVRSCIFQTYCRKIDGRLLNIRSRESLCHRLLSAQREDFNVAVSIVQGNQEKDERLRQIINEFHMVGKGLSDEILMVRSESSRLADDLHSSKHMEASTMLRARSIDAEISCEDDRHAAEMMVITKQIEKCRGKKSAFTIQHEQMTEELNLHRSKIHELWLASAAIQAEEGHDAISEPTECGCSPNLGMESILKAVAALDHKLGAITAARTEGRAKCDLLTDEMCMLQADHASLTKACSEVIEASQRTQKVELERTKYQEDYLAELEAERGNVEKLRSSLDELQNNLVAERNRLEEELNRQIEEDTKRHADMYQLRRSLSINRDALVDFQERHESEKTENYSKLEAYKSKLHDAKTAFAKVQVEVETFRDDDNAALDEEAAEIVSVQEMMLEETASEIARILQGNPILTQLQYHFDASKTREGRIVDALTALQGDCMKRKKEILLKQKRVLARIRLEREQIENNSLLAEACERKMAMKFEEPRKLKRRLEREENRRKRVIVGAAQGTAKQHTYDGSRRADEAGTQSCKEASGVACSRRSKKDSITEDVIKPRSGNAVTKDSGKKRPSDDVGTSQVRFAKDSPSEAEVVGGVDSEGNIGRTNVLSGRESRRRREKGEWEVTPNDRSNDRETAVSLLDLGSTSIGKPVRSFMTLFEDEKFSQADAGDVVGGCLTQRVGLEFPTPKSKVSESPNIRRRKSNSQWEKERKATIEPLNSDGIAESVKWTQALDGAARGSNRPSEDTMETQSRRKVFGSTSQRNKASSRSQNEQGRSSRSSFSKTATRQSTVGATSDPTPPSKPPARRLPSTIEGDAASVLDEPPSSTRASHKSPRAIRTIQPRTCCPEPSVRNETPAKSSNQCTSLPTISWRSSTPLLEEATAPLKRPVDVDSKVSVMKKAKVAATSTVERSTDRDRSGSKRSAVTPHSVEKPTARERFGTKRSAIAQAHGNHHPMSSSQTRHCSSHDFQASGISSGERGMSKSRRRKGHSGAIANGMSSVKAVPARLDDFSFNF